MTTVATSAENRIRRLPAWAPWAILAASMALAAGILALGQGPTIAGVLLIGALLYVVALTAVSRAVEGHRYAKDRLATTLVTVAVLRSVVPLVSLVITVVVTGIGALSLDFVTTDMVGVFGQDPGGGAYHAVIGTLYVVGIAALVSIPLGIFTAIYLVEYGGGRIKRAITVLVDVMTGIPSIVAGLLDRKSTRLNSS